MKTAISIPDPIFEAAETVSQRLGISRSEFYAKAISEYLRELRYDRVKEQLDEVYKNESSSLDPLHYRLQLNSLKREEW